MKKTIIFIAAAVCLMASGCAQKETTTTGSVAQEYLNLWLNTYHPEAVANASGIYILEDEPGTGKEWDKDITYTFLNTTIRTLNGVISATGHEAVAQQLGTYQAGNYYGPSVTITGNGYAGVEALLTGMRPGGTRTAVIPAWLLTTDRYSTQKEYLEACSSATSLIYTVTYSEQTDDITKWEQEKIRDYAISLGGKLQPRSFNEETEEANIFFFFTSGAPKADQDTIPSGKKVLLNYTGRLLNGQVFDTTIEKIAKDNGIYDSSRTYAPVTITTSNTYSSIALDGSTSLVDGFQGALSLMKYVGERSIAVFTSDLGYTSTGSGSKIPPYAPLCFDFEYVSLSE